MMALCQLPQCCKWEAVDALQADLIQKARVDQMRQACRAQAVDINVTRPNVTREVVLRLIDEVIYNVTTNIARGERPLLKIDSRNTWDNIRFTEEGLQQIKDAVHTCFRFDSFHSLNKFAQMFKVLEIIYRLVQSGSYCTKRDIYYQDPTSFQSQNVVDDIVDDISCMLKVSRWHLHVLATSKGLVAGNLKFTEENGSFTDCSQSQCGVSVPNHIEGISNLQTEARFVLVVEKDATFQKLLDDRFSEKMGPCIMITGKGFPDLNSRLLVKRLWNTFKLPIFALMDADPHGIEIMLVYKYGSRSLSFETPNLAVPCLKWLGVLPSDIDRWHVDDSCTAPLTKTDQSKIDNLLKRPYFSGHSPWKTEIQHMLQKNRKAEIQCLNYLGEHFLANMYLPSKFRLGVWL